MVRQPVRSEFERWIVLVLASAYIVVGIGFSLRYIWARGSMWVLMGIVELFFVYGMLAFGRTLDCVGFAVATYTFLFLANSAASHFKIMLNSGRI